MKKHACPEMNEEWGILFLGSLGFSVIFEENVLDFKMHIFYGYSQQAY